MKRSPAKGPGTDFMTVYYFYFTLLTSAMKLSASVEADTVEAAVISSFSVRYERTSLSQMI